MGKTDLCARRTWGDPAWEPAPTDISARPFYACADQAAPTHIGSSTETPVCSSLHIPQVSLGRFPRYVSVDTKIEQTIVGLVCARHPA
jgi:hypothetical protein